MDRYLASFIDHACLCYDEARHVWHLIKAGHVPPGPFELLRTLPTNTFDAWQAMAPLRSEAMASGTAHSASEIFTKRFGLSLDDLAQLYGNPNWRSGGYGGNPWVQITAAVVELQSAIEDGDDATASEVVQLLPEMRHNTGALGEKLELLNRPSDADRYR